MTRPQISNKSLQSARIMRQNPTKEEAKLWGILRKNQLDGIHFRRQHPIGPYIVDFCALRQRMIIELDGSPHTDQNEYDHERTHYLRSKGYRVLRFWNDEVMNDIDAVLMRIEEEFKT
jgi:very-short-patch-repair endonuclease